MSATQSDVPMSMRLGEGVAAPFTVFDGFATSPRLDHAECVAVAPDGALWCGGEAGQVFRIVDGGIQQIATTEGFILGLAFADDGHLLLCDAVGPCLWLLDTTTGELQLFADSVDGQELLSPNFPVKLPDGSFLVSDSGTPRGPRPGLLHFDREGRGRVWHDQPLHFANGLALSPDHTMVYIAESWAHRIAAVPLSPECTPGGRIETYADLGKHLPDGVAVETTGRVYVGCYEPSAILHIPGPGQVELFAHDESAHVLCHPTNLAFRGSELIVANLGRWHLTGFDLSQAESGT